MKENKTLMQYFWDNFYKRWSVFLSL